MGAGRRGAGLEPPIDLTPMSNTDDKHPQDVVAHLVDDPVVPDPDAKKALGAGEFIDPGRAGGVAERIDPERYPAPDIMGKALEVTDRGRL